MESTARVQCVRDNNNATTQPHNTHNYTTPTTTQHPQPPKHKHTKTKTHLHAVLREQRAELRAHVLRLPPSERPVRVSKVKRLRPALALDVAAGGAFAVVAEDVEGHALPLCPLFHAPWREAAPPRSEGNHVFFFRSILLLLILLLLLLVVVVVLVLPLSIVVVVVVVVVVVLFFKVIAVLPLPLLHPLFSLPPLPLIPTAAAAAAAAAATAVPTPPPVALRSVEDEGEV